MREDVFRRKVVKLAQENGWRVVFFHRLPTKGQQWRTPVGGDGAGWPDLILVRERVIFVELKGEKGRLSPEQAGWLAALQAAGAEVYLWKPRDWDEIVFRLNGHNDRQLRLEVACGGDKEQAESVLRMLQ